MEIPIDAQRTPIDSHIWRGYDLVIGLIDQGQYEGWFKSALESENEIIEAVGETPGESLKNLRMKLKQL